MKHEPFYSPGAYNDFLESWKYIKSKGLFGRQRTKEDKYGMQKARRKR